MDVTTDRFKFFQVASLEDFLVYHEIILKNVMINKTNRFTKKLKDYFEDE